MTSELVLNGIKYNGISLAFPENIKYFTDFMVNRQLIVDKCKPNINTITASSIQVTISKVSLINTQIKRSFEGQHLSGKKLIVDTQILINTKYIGGEDIIDMYIERILILKHISIVVPAEVNGNKIEDIVRKDKFSITPYVENVLCEKKGSNVIDITASILLNVEFF